MTRIKYIVPFAFGDQAIALRAAQIPRDALDADTQVDCVPVRNHPRDSGSYYETSIFDMYIAEAGFSAEDEGYDAVIMDTVSDSGLYALRSRLSIPVIGPGLVSYTVAVMLGKKFSVITYLPEHRFLYEKTLENYQLSDKCASIRTANIVPDFEALFTENAEHEFERLTEVALEAIEKDGADVILLGSTTMHQAGEYMARHLPAPVINPGPVAIKIAETFVALGLSHSKVAFPPPRTIQDQKWFSLIAAQDEVDDRST